MRFSIFKLLLFVYYLFICCIIYISHGQEKHHTRITTFSTTTRYIYIHAKSRTEKNILAGQPWMVGQNKPLVPGNREYYSNVKIGEKPNAPCDKYKFQERDVYLDSSDANKPKYYYPFTSWVKNCDVRRFLMCDDEYHCKCWPGMYWDENSTVPIAHIENKKGRCLVGYKQSCEVYKAYNFALTPQCGENMVCDENTKICECDKNKPTAVYNAPVLDGHGHIKYFCDIQRRKNLHESCYEYMALDINKKSTTKTGCGDITGQEENNIYCKFPPSQTGDKPVGPDGKPVQYGQRQGGNCSCTDEQLGYEYKIGCRPKVGAKCINGIVNYTGRIQPNKINEEMTSSCGGRDKPIANDISMCKENSKGKGICICIKGKSKTNKSSGLCVPMDGTENSNANKNVGAGTKCISDEECYDYNQYCYNRKCTCLPGWKVGTDNLCKGLYGIRCIENTKKKDGKGDCYQKLDEKRKDGFECIEVPEMSLINTNEFPKEQKYCICQSEYLNPLSGLCGACTLNPPQFGFLILFIYIIKILQSHTLLQN